VRLRALAPVLACAAALAAAPALAEDEDDPRPQLVLWHAYRASEAGALERFVKELNERETGYRVKVLKVPYDAFLDKITAAIPRGKGPDLFIAAHDTIGDWAEAKTIQPVDDLLDPQSVARLEAGLVPAVLYKGAAYGLPIAFKSVALWRNTERAPDAPRTMQQLVDTAKRNTGDGSYGLVYENRLLYFHAGLMHGAGGALFADDGKPAIHSPENVASVKLAMELANDLKIVPQETSGTLATALFNDGKAAFLVTGPWSLGEIERAPGTWAVSPLPELDTGKRWQPLLSVEAVMISGKTDKRELAVRLAQEIASPEGSRQRLTGGLQPVALKSAWEALEDADVAQPMKDVLLAFRAQLPHSVPTPNTPAMKAMWSPTDLALGQSIGQGKDPNETLAEAQKKLEGVLADVERKDEPADPAGFYVLLVLLGLALVGWMFVGIYKHGARALFTDAWRNRAAYIYLAPALIGMGVLVFVPFAFGVGMGFFRHTWGDYTFVALENYTRILGGSDSRFFYTLGITVLWTASNVFLHVLIGVVLALILSQARLRFRGLYRVLFILPWAVPNYITALIWKGMFHPELGAINAVLGLEGFSWMNQTWSAFLTNLVTNTWLGFPFMMVTALGGLTAIPKDLYEAAALDGAGPLRRFFTITLPLLRPTLAPAIVLGTVWTFNMFNVIYLVSGGAPGGDTDILITEAFRWAFERGQGGAFGYASAYSTLIFLMLLAYTTAANRVTRAISGDR
jgi:arabinogalactan oligomer/maltooligosaccharide transport system permease protein